MIIKAYISCLIICVIGLIISIVPIILSVGSILQSVKSGGRSVAFVINLGVLIFQIVALIGIIILIITTPEVIEEIDAVSNHFKEMQESMRTYTSNLSNIHLYVESLLKNETSSKTIYYKYKRIVNEASVLLPQMGAVFRMCYNIRQYGLIRGAIQTIMDSQKEKEIREIWVELGDRVENQFDLDQDQNQDQNQDQEQRDQEQDQEQGDQGQDQDQNNMPKSFG